MDVVTLQNNLNNLGFNPGPIDGVMGPLTRHAIRSFQAAKGLTVDGIVGPNTRSALFGADTHDPQPDKAVPLDMPWLVEAERLLNTREKPGPADNPVIMDWARVLNIGYSSDEVPWCGLFVGHCMGSSLPEEPLPANLLGARKWMGFGKKVTPQMGSVLVFWRSSPESWKGHVGYYWAEDSTHFHVLGGNQSNAVNIKRLAKSRLLQARWPNMVPPHRIVRVASSSGVFISTSEA